MKSALLVKLLARFPCLPLAEGALAVVACFFAEESTFYPFTNYSHLTRCASKRVSRKHDQPGSIVSAVRSWLVLQSKRRAARTARMSAITGITRRLFPALSRATTPPVHRAAPRSCKSKMTSLIKTQAPLPGWKPNLVSQVPGLHDHLANMTPEDIQRQAPLPALSQASKKIVFTHDSCYATPEWHEKTALEARYPNKSLNTYEVGSLSLYRCVRRTSSTSSLLHSLFSL